MVKYKITPPAKIKEVITPTEFVTDYELMERVVHEKMMTYYVTILFICTIVLAIVVIL